MNDPNNTFYPREKFIEEDLGFLSSHKVALVKRRQWMWWLSFLPVTLAVMLYGFFIKDVGNFASMMGKTESLIRTVALLGCFSISSFLTLAITSAFALKRGNEGEQGRVSIRQPQSFGFDHLTTAILFFLTLLISVGAIGFLAVDRNQDVRLRSAIVFLSALPLLVLFALAFPGSSNNRGSARFWSKLLSLAEIILLLVAIVFVIFSIQGAMQYLQQNDIARTLGYLLPQFNGLLTGAQGAAILITAIFALLALRSRFRQLFEQSLEASIEASNPYTDKDSRQEEIPREGIITRMFRWLVGWNKPDTDTAPIPIDQRVVSLFGRRLEDTVTIEATPGTTESGDSLLFRGLLPTSSQLQALSAFRQLYYKETEKGISSTDADRSCDILIHGQVFSGKTEGMLACLIEAACNRGQHVIVIANQSSRVTELKARIVDGVRFLSLAKWISIEDLNSQVRNNLEASPPLIPQILITTIHNLQQLLYDNSQLTAVLELYECLFVDKLDRFESSARAHLPFLIDKQRWLIESRNLVFQSVVTCEDLHLDGVEYLLARLSSTTSSVRRDFEMQPIPIPKVRLLTATGTESLKEIFEASDLKSEEECLFLDEHSPELSSPSKPTTEKRKAIIFEGKLDKARLSSLRYHYCETDSLIVCREYTDTNLLKIPMLVQRTAPIFRSNHLLNLVRHIDHGSLIPLAVAQRFGLDPRTVPKQPSDLTSVPTAGLKFYWENLSLREGQPPCNYLELLENGQAIEHSVPPHQVPYLSHKINLDGLNSIISCLDSPNGPQQSVTPSRLVSWKNEADQDLPYQTDLSYLRKMEIHDHEPIALIGNSLDKFASGFQSRCQRPIRNNDNQLYCMPRYAYELSLPASEQVEKGNEETYSMESIFPNTTIRFGDIKVQSNIACSTKVKIDRLWNQLGNSVQLDGAEFDYPTNLSYVLLSPSGTTYESISEILSRFDPNTGFEPVLSLAFALAFEKRIDGILRFGVPLLYRLNENTKYYLAIWVSPSSVDWTVSHTLRKTFSKVDFRKVVMRELKDVISQALSAQAPDQWLRNQVGYDHLNVSGDDTIKNDLKHFSDFIFSVR
jgi:hypothetical protein